MSTIKTTPIPTLRLLALETTDKASHNIVQPIHILARNSQDMAPPLPFIATFLFKMDPRATRKRIKGFTCVQLGKAGGGGGMCEEVLNIFENLTVGRALETDLGTLVREYAPGFEHLVDCIPGIDEA